MSRAIPFAFPFVTVWLANGGQAAPLAFKRDIPEARCRSQARPARTRGSATAVRSSPITSALVAATLHWELADLPDMIVVAVGAFADPTFLTPQVSVYGSRRHPWVDISGRARREN